jgi:ferredoxin
LLPQYAVPGREREATMSMPPWLTALHARPFCRFKDAWFRMTNFRALSPVIDRAIGADNMVFTHVPINEDIATPPGTPLPPAIVERLIDEASYHVVLRQCFCRTTWSCEEYPAGFGCTFLGEGARQISPGMGKHVGKEEALEHYRRACEMGLITIIGKFLGDARGLGVRDHNRLMTICHCCPCCCVRTATPLATREYRDLFEKLEGLTVRVDPDLCIGCGTCVDFCTFASRSVSGGTAVVGEECRGCGLCATRCPTGATRLEIDDPDYVDGCIARIGKHVDVW